MYFLPDKSSISKDYTGGKVELINNNRYIGSGRAAADVNSLPDLLFKAWKLPIFSDIIFKMVFSKKEQD